MTEQQNETFDEQSSGASLPDTGPDSNLEQFLAANKIDLDRLRNPGSAVGKTPEEQR